jgi:hypothetical protein
VDVENELQLVGLTSVQTPKAVKKDNKHVSRLSSSLTWTSSLAGWGLSSDLVRVHGDLGSTSSCRAVPRAPPMRSQGKGKGVREVEHQRSRRSHVRDRGTWTAGMELMADSDTLVSMQNSFGARAQGRVDHEGRLSCWRRKPGIMRMLRSSGANEPERLSADAGRRNNERRGRLRGSAGVGAASG